MASKIDETKNAQSQDSIRRQSAAYAELLNDSAAGRVTRTIHELIQHEVEVLTHIEGSKEAATSLILIDILKNPKISFITFKQVKQSLKDQGPYDSLKLQKMGKCAVEVADKRRHAIRAVTVDLFYEACVLHGHNQQEMIRELAKRKEINDHTLKAIVVEQKKQFRDRDIVKFCAKHGYPLTSVELAVRFPDCEKCFMDILSSLQPISYYTHRRVRNDEIAVEAFNRLTPNLHSLDCIDENRNNVLHLAGDKGLTALTIKILDYSQENARLLLEKNSDGRLPVTVCLTISEDRKEVRDHANYATAAVMLRAMKDWKVCVVSRPSDQPAVRFQELLLQLANLRRSRRSEEFKVIWYCFSCSLPNNKPDTEKQKEQKKMRTQNRHKTTQDTQDTEGTRDQEDREDTDDTEDSDDIVVPSYHCEKHIVECIEAIMDATIDKSRRIVDYGLLEADRDGFTPDNKNYNSLARTTIAIVAQNNLEVVAGHGSFRDLIKYKWHLYGWKFYLVPLLLSLSYLVLLTISLALAAQVEDPSKYSSHMDKGCSFCEILVFMWIPVDISIEAIDFIINYNGNVRKYFTEWRNLLDVIAVLMTLLIIPFRFINSDVQWIFASLAYIFHGLRLFEYAIILRFFGVYVEVLVHVIIQDLRQFLLVFTVFMTIYGGGFYFALRGQTCPLIQNDVGSAFDPIVNTSLCLHADETGEIYRIWLTGIRLLAEGENIIFHIYFKIEDSGLASIIYIVFLFLVVVILLNLLIAQFTKSYEEEIGRARVSVTLNRAKALSRMWNPLWMEPLEKIRRLSKISYYRPSSVITIEDKPAKDLEQLIQISKKQLTEDVTQLKQDVTQLTKVLTEQTVMIKELRAAVMRHQPSDCW